MGIKNLLKFLSDYPDIIKNIDIKEYFGKKIAIDISILLYQVVIAIRNSGSDLTNEKGEITSHILGLFNKTLGFLEKGIIPVYVFDGKPPDIKYKMLMNRKQTKKKALLKLADVETEAEKIKYLKRSVCITKEHMDQCRELLDLMGISYINAPEEADSQLSYLCKTNMVYAVLTEDMDILTFGSPKIIRNLISTKKKPFEIDLFMILNKLKLTYEEFIELCILLGCDYCNILNDIKPNDIYNVYIKQKSIEKTLEEFRKRNYNVPDKFNYEDAKKYFLKSSYNYVDHIDLELKKPDYDKLLNLLVGKYGFIKYKIITKLNKLTEYHELFKNY